MPTTRLSWQANGGSCAVAVAAHRAAAAGIDVRDFEGDFIVGDGAAARRAAVALGLEVSRGGVATGAALHPPRIALFGGDAAAYPYYAYYSHCLLSLGLPYRSVTGADIAGGALEAQDLLIIPGGFAIWGLDRAEDTSGADRAVADFLRRGGAAIGSCGGSFYLSAGRPQWTATANTKPKYTHEYLLTGAAVVNVHIDDPRLGRGCPEDMEICYYHGPAYSNATGDAEALAHFSSLCLPSRLFIDNPLEREAFERDLAGRPAVLLADGGAGHAVLFSPHPEMGDFLRKHIALDGYVRKYLPLRGRKIMDETLRYYAPEDAPAFRLVLNAMRILGVFDDESGEPARAAEPSQQGHLVAALESLDTAMGRACAHLHDKLGQDVQTPWHDLVAADLAGGEQAWRAARVECIRLSAQGEQSADPGFVRELIRLSRDAAASLAVVSDAPLIQGLALFELPVRLLCAAVRFLRCDAALRS